MSLLVKSYDLKNVICSVGGVPISGYGETDAIGLEWASDIAEPHLTADGDTIYSRLNNRGLTITLTLSQKSQAHLLLYGLIETQHGDNLGIHPPFMVPVPFLLTDPATGEVIAGVAVFLSRPAPSKNKTVGDVQYKLHIGNPKIGPAVANVI